MVPGLSTLATLGSQDIGFVLQRKVKAEAKKRSKKEQEHELGL